MIKTLIHDRRGNSLVENIIVLPVIFIAIYFLVLAGFVMHDRSTLDSAVSRGAGFAAKCIADPFYAKLIEQGSINGGALDTDNADIASLVFTTKKRIGDPDSAGINPYRYVTSSFKKTVERNTEQKIIDIIDQTKLPWHEIDPNDIACTINNYVVYQKITVSAKAVYPLPKLFSVIGLPDKLEYEAHSVATVTDPDELIRNSDFVVDVICEIDSSLGEGSESGGPLQKLSKMMEDFKVKITDSKFVKFLTID